MKDSADDLLRTYWRENGLLRLPLETVSLNDVCGQVDPQQVDMIKTRTEYSLARSRLDEPSFKTLVFIENDDTRLVTVDDRSLEGVVANIDRCYGSLETMFGLAWFEKVGSIYHKFDYSQFGHLLLRVPTSARERSQSHGGSCYIEGGNHRCLALAIKILREDFQYQSLEAIIYFEVDC